MALEVTLKTYTGTFRKVYQAGEQVLPSDMVALTDLLPKSVADDIESDLGRYNITSTDKGGTIAASDNPDTGTGRLLPRGYRGSRNLLGRLRHGAAGFNDQHHVRVGRHGQLTFSHGLVVRPIE